jgi:hypothetical protein
MKMLSLCHYRLLALATLLALFWPPAAGAQSTLQKPQLDCLVERSRKVRIEGGDHDDKIERVSFDINLTNKNWKEPVEGLTGTFYVFGQSVHDRKAFKLVQKETFPVEIDARGKFTATTPVAEMKFDTTFASFGEKYRGWVLRLENGDGDTVFEQASSVFLSDTEQLPKLAVGEFCDKETKKIAEPQRKN